MRYKIINPVTNVIDECVGEQWYDVPNFWEGGRSDPATIHADPSETLFHIAIYGELFGPDLESFIYQSQANRLKVETRLEFIKYCVPDFNIESIDHFPSVSFPDGTIDPRRECKPTGPYKVSQRTSNSGCNYMGKDHANALVHVVTSSRWKPRWKRLRQIVGCLEFVDGLVDDTWDGIHYQEFSEPQIAKQRLLEHTMMLSGGLEGLGMISPALHEAERVDRWGAKLRQWRAAIAALSTRPEVIRVGTEKTWEYPLLLGDLNVCLG